LKSAGYTLPEAP